MKNFARFLSAAMTLVIVSSTNIYAWNKRGHMMVAAIAYKKLDQSTKNRIHALLLKNPDRPNWLALVPPGTPAIQKRMVIFMIAATWADRIKKDSQYHKDGSHDGNRPPNDPSASQNIGYTDFAMHKYWHFVDMPFSNDGTPLPIVPTPNAKTQIDTFRAIIASDSPAKLKSYDLSWLLHLIGDVHQPLHCTTRVGATQLEGDDGGNGVKLTPSNNLHSFWDDVLGNSETISSVLNAISSLPAATDSMAMDLDVDHWITESFNAAQTDVYKLPVNDGAGPFTLDDSYKTRAREIARERIALAGARLAKILNEELK